MKKLFLILCFLFVVAVLGATWFYRAEVPESSNISKTYDSQKFGFRFIYPARYFLEEKEIGDGHRWHYFVSLTDDTEENRLVHEGNPPDGGSGREGPIAITFDIFQNDLDELTVPSWIKTRGESNFKLSDGALEYPVYGGAYAAQYRWSGLYNGESAVFRHRDAIIMATATSITPDDFTIKDFPAILASLKFIP